MKATEYWLQHRNHLHVLPNKEVYYYGRRIQSRYDEEELLRWIRINHYHSPVWFADVFLGGQVLITCYVVWATTLTHKGTLPHLMDTNEYLYTVKSLA